MTAQDVINQGWTEVRTRDEGSVRWTGWVPARVLSGDVFMNVEANGQKWTTIPERCRRPSDMDVLRFRQREL